MDNLENLQNLVSRNQENRQFTKLGFERVSEDIQLNTIVKSTRKYGLRHQIYFGYNHL